MLTPTLTCLSKPALTPQPQGQPRTSHFTQILMSLSSATSLSLSSLLHPPIPQSMQYIKHKIYFSLRFLSMRANLK